MRLLSYKNIHVKILRISHRTPLTSPLNVMSAEIKDSVDQISTSMIPISVSQILEQRTAIEIESGCTDCPDQHGSNLNHDDTRIILLSQTPPYRAPSFTGAFSFPQIPSLCIK